MIEREPFRRVVIAHRDTVCRRFGFLSREVLAVLQLVGSCRYAAAKLIEHARNLALWPNLPDRLATIIDGRVTALPADLLN